MLKPSAASPSFFAKPLGGVAALIAFALTASGTLVLSLPRVLAGWPLWRDSVEYAAIGWNLATGRGLSNPLMFTTYLEGVAPPLPALAMRPVAHTVLLALPLALGASLTELRVAHAVWSSMIGASAVWMARRAMTGPAAIAFAMAVCWSYAWILAAQQLMSETTASGIVLLSLALYPGARASHRRALALACAVVLGWLARPNVAVLALAVPVALVLERGPRRALRCRPLWTFTLAFAALVTGVHLAHWLATGFFPYQQYGTMFEGVELASIPRHRWEDPRWRGLLGDGAPDVAVAIAGNASMMAREIFLRGAYLHVGWLGVPALLYAFGRWRARPERIYAACAAVLLWAGTLPVIVGFSPLRYLLPGAVCVWFVVCALLGDVAARSRARLAHASRSGIGRVARGAAALPIVVVVLLSGADNWLGWIRTAPADLRSYAEDDGRPRRDPARAPLRALCRRIDRDAVVAVPDPWLFYLVCGTATMKIPFGIEDPAAAEEYLARVPLGFLILDPHERFDALRTSARLQRVASRGPLALYRVREPLPGSRPWKAPPPLPQTSDVPTL